MAGPEDYGFVALLAQRVPEVGSLMQQAVAGQWTSAKFQMELANTNWWKTTPGATRSWISEQVGDPATAARNLQTGADEIGAMAAQLGYSGVDPARLKTLWLNAKLAGYDASLTKAYVMNDLSLWGGSTQTPTGGEFGQRVQEAKALAAAYGYNPSDLDTQVQGVARTGITSLQDRTVGLAGWRDKLTKYAAAKYAPFADRIQAGETVQDLAQPYIDTYAQLLELNSNDVSLDDPLVQRWMQGTSEAGKPPAAVPVWKAQQELRQDARWRTTTNARETAAKAATQLGKMFGMVGS